MKDKAKKQKGKGLFDIIKNPISHIKEFLAPIPTKLSSKSNNTLKEYGNKPIKALTIIRTPLQKHFTEALNSISLGAFETLQKKYGYDQLFHLSLLADVEDKVIIIEKNEVVHISPIDKNAIRPNTEYYNLALNKQLTLNEMIDKTLNFMGSKLFYDYDALGVDGKKANNCQNFIKSILESNNLLTSGANNFIYQDLSGIKKDLEKSGFGYVPNAVKFVTNFASKTSRLLGKGKKNKNKNVVDLVINDQFRFL